MNDGELVPICSRSVWTTMCPCSSDWASRASCDSIKNVMTNAASPNMCVLDWYFVCFVQTQNISAIYQCHMSWKLAELRRGFIVKPRQIYDWAQCTFKSSPFTLVSDLRSISRPRESRSRSWCMRMAAARLQPYSESSWCWQTRSRVWRFIAKQVRKKRGQLKYKIIHLLSGHWSSSLEDAFGSHM